MESKLEENLIQEVSYYNKDFEWDELKAKYASQIKKDCWNESKVPSDYSIKWEEFYQQNNDNFFKDRKYLHKCFSEIKEKCDSCKKKKKKNIPNLFLDI